MAFFISKMFIIYFFAKLHKKEVPKKRIFTTLPVRFPSGSGPVPLRSRSYQNRPKWGGDVERKWCG
jgi:hypothetical protein